MYVKGQLVGPESGGEDYRGSYSSLLTPDQVPPFVFLPKIRISCLFTVGDGHTLIVECVYWTEPKVTSHQDKNQPNACNMHTDLEGILSAYLYLHVSLYPGVVNFCRYIFSQALAKFKYTKRNHPKEY